MINFIGGFAFGGIFAFIVYVILFANNDNEK